MNVADRAVCSLATVLVVTLAAPAKQFVIRAQAATGPAATLRTTNNTAHPPASQPQSTQPVWIEDFEQAYQQARETRRPILVRAGAPWCGWCRKLDVELATPLVQAQLARWVLVYLDIDARPQDARRLNIGPIPALRLLSPSGAVAARHDGFIPAAELAGWLQQEIEKAASAVSEDLLVDGPIDLAIVNQLVARLDVQDSGTREAIVRRLAPHRERAGRAVTVAFAEGRLAARLSALELLREWKAPVEALDPWDPPSISAARLAALQKWAQELPAVPTTNPASQPQATLNAEDEAQLERLLSIQDPAARTALIEQLARRGDALRPAVYARRKNPQDLQARAALTLLRYRLAASSALLVSWPGGLERLSAPDASIRQIAAQELASRASPAEARLLIELFSDSDPLVRELCLTSLREVGGDEAARAITQLLDDPDSNVRAAVLKVLAAKPNPGVVAIICDYAARESDADLVGHAARALRAARTSTAGAGLIKLLDHASWRVRAEAAEGLAEVLRGQSNAQSLQADGYAALIRRLDDEDTFVASRALAALEHSPVLATALEPMLRMLDRHPELAGSVIEAFGSDDALRMKALPQLRTFCTHSDPSVRAAAIRAVCQAAGNMAQAQIAAGLSDTVGEVRLAAAEGLFEYLESLRQQRAATAENRPIARAIIRTLFRSPAAASPTDSAPASQPATPPSVTWLDAFDRGAKRPAWLETLAAPLASMLAGGSSDEQLRSALCLAALNRREASVARLRQLVDESPERLRSAGAVLAWLRPSERVALFRDWYPKTRSAAELAELSRHLAAWPEPQVLGGLWDVLSQDRLAPEAASGVFQAMIEIHLGDHRWMPGEAPGFKLLQMGADARQHMAGPAELQRTVALALLAMASREDAAAAARAIIPDSAASPALRCDALQILLLTEPRTRGVEHAVAAIQAGEPGARRAGLRYLAMGPLYVRQLRGHIDVNVDPSSEFQAMYRSEAPTYEPPAGLKPAALVPLLTDPDRETAACAAYLLALYKRMDAIPLLVRFWRELGQRDEMHRQLLYRAIAAANDASHVTVLEEIYAAFDKGDYAVRDFYWSIRPMTGERVLALRKRIRDEVGMQNLR